MKLPEKIKGRKKLRDAQILMAWSQNHEDYAVIAKRFGIKERRVLQILRANHRAMPIDKEWEKLKRVERLQRWLIKNPNTRRDPMDVMEQLRKEIEGDKPLIDQSQHVTQVTYVWQNDSDTLQPPRLSEADSFSPGEI